MNALGTHLLLELKDCNRNLLDDLPYIRHALLEAAEKTGATIIGESFHQFSPQGVTGVVAIAESHLCIHTWPEFGYAAVDIFTCGEGFKPREAAKMVVKSLESEEHSITEIERGVLLELAVVSAG
ncbi:MAG: adenosylmethionine decarboxylase [Dehalococcoidia bacterium]|nr:adenosylmethionine decarboxylase [Dehalococcoidia bacterium]MDP6494086.1 adenosylmethionine decarboxylase [Dehalococcoidia bacterium]